MKISIITIVYNNADSIEDAILSVLSQTYTNIEYIVIDGASNDGTINVISKYLDKISYYVSESDNGLYSALNKGVGIATGDVVGILHSDDLFYSKQTVDHVVKKFKETNADLVYANGMFVNQNDTKEVKRVYMGKNHKNYYLNFGWIPLHTTIFLKKEVYEKYGLYDENYAIAGDYDISLKWFKEHEIKKVYLDKFVVKMRLGGKSTTAKLQKKKSKEDLQIIRKHKLLGTVTLMFKIGRKIPQYILPRIKKY